MRCLLISSFRIAATKITRTCESYPAHKFDKQENTHRISAVAIDLTMMETVNPKSHANISYSDDTRWLDSTLDSSDHKNLSFARPKHKYVRSIRIGFYWKRWDLQTKNREVTYAIEKTAPQCVCVCGRWRLEHRRRGWACDFSTSKFEDKISKLEYTVGRFSTQI